MSIGSAAAAGDTDDLTHLVNPFIGSQKEGNTFPGAAVPFGMVQLSPDTGHSTGYDWGRNRIRGFSSVHLSGVGCSLGGDLPVLPTTGAITSTDYGTYAAPFSHADETASPGYYKVKLGTGITAELSATERTGWQRYTFPATGQANVLLNTGQSLHTAVSSTVTVVDDHTVVTAITGRGFCGKDTQPYTVYTETRFDRPFASFGTWNGSTVTAGSKTSTSTGRAGAYVRFDTTKDQQVTAVTSLSWVGADGAAKNLAAEGTGTFDATAAAAKQAWQDRLSEVRVQGGSSEQRRTFYSSLYRSMLAPNVGSDADGRYMGWDGKVHTADGFTYYQNWSLWDTYRTQQQLLSLLAPQESRDMALSMLRVADESGQLPRWGYATVETNVMTGDPATPFLVDAWRQGLLKGHEEEAYQVLKKHVDSVPPADSPSAVREADKEYLANGYVPYDTQRPQPKPGNNDFRYGASATLEYALADAAVGGMAKELGHLDDAHRYLARGQNYRNVFDRSTGWFRPRGSNGLFVGPTDPKQGRGFHEGSAWQYMWLVPQDVRGMVDLIGGKDAANKRLDSFFAYDELLKDPAGTARDVWVNGPYAYYNADKYNPQNEPDLGAPYTYLSTGQPWKTTDVVHAALTLYTDGPDGVTGNDDLGTMSAWHVLSSIGIYPVAPGTDQWGLSTPVFDRVDLTLDKKYYPRGSMTISAPGTSDTDRYIQSAQLDGKELRDTYITTEDIRQGESLSFTVGSTPSSWGTDDSDAPPALDDVPDIQRRMVALVSPNATGVVPGGSGTDLTVSTLLTAPSETVGSVTVSAPKELVADPDRTQFQVESGTLPTPHKVTIHITAPEGTPAGTYPVTVRVAQAAGSVVTKTVPVSVAAMTCSGTSGYCPQDLSAQYDTDGVVAAGANGANGFDGGGMSYPAEQMPAKGPGAAGGRAYDFPDTTGTAANFATAHGQSVSLVERAYSALDLLLATHHGDVKSTATVHYSDGSSATVALAATDWAASAPHFGEDAAIHADTRYNRQGSPDGTAVNVWHVAIPLDSGKKAVSITLPNNNHLEVYAISGRNA